MGDDLKNSLTEKELEVVILQEAAHFKLNHIAKLYGISMLLMTLTFALFMLGIYIAILNNSDIVLFVSIAATAAIVWLLTYYILFRAKRIFGLKANIYAASIVKKERFSSMLDRVNTVSDGELTKGSHFVYPLHKRLDHLKRT